MYRLLSATPSPYARKVRIALAEKAIPFDLLTEVPWDRTTATPQHNPLEKLPVLIFDDGGSVYDSRFILEFLELRHPLPRLLPDDVDGILAAKRLEVLCDGVCDATVLILVERMRPEAFRSDAWTARQRRKVEGGLREIARLVDGREWAVGDRFGLGDIAVGTVFSYVAPRLPELDLRQTFPDLASLVDRLETRPSFRDSRPAPMTMTDKVV